MTVYDWSKCKRETLEELAHAVLSYEADPHEGAPISAAMEKAKQEARPPLRSRSEVDAEIARIVRERYQAGFYLEALTELCAEPVAPDEAAQCSACANLQKRLDRIAELLQGPTLDGIPVHQKALDVLDRIVAIARATD